MGVGFRFGVLICILWYMREKESERGRGWMGVGGTCHSLPLACGRVLKGIPLASPDAGPSWRQEQCEARRAGGVCLGSPVQGVAARREQ